MTLGFGRPDAAPVDTDVLLEWAISPNGPAFGIELAVVGVAGEPEVGVMWPRGITVAVFATVRSFNEFGSARKC